MKRHLCCISIIASMAANAAFAGLTNTIATVNGPTLSTNAIVLTTPTAMPVSATPDGQPPKSPSQNPPPKSPGQPTPQPKDPPKPAPKPAPKDAPKPAPAPAPAPVDPAKVDPKAKDAKPVVIPDVPGKKACEAATFKKAVDDHIAKFNIDCKADNATNIPGICEVIKTDGPPINTVVDCTCYQKDGKTPSATFPGVKVTITENVTNCALKLSQEPKFKGCYAVGKEGKCYSDGKVVPLPIKIEKK